MTINEPAIVEAMPTPVSPVRPDGLEPDHSASDAHCRTVGFEFRPFLELRILAECFADAQETRKAIVNRVERGGADPDLFAAQVEVVRAAEHTIGLALVRRYRSLTRAGLSGVYDWQRRSGGIGEHLLARILGHLGHPRIATPCHWEGSGETRRLVADMPFVRTVAQLWAYCGHGDPARRRVKGMSAEEAFGLGNPRLKMLVFLAAESAIKQPGSSLPPPMPPTGSPDTAAVEGGLSDNSHADADIQRTRAVVLAAAPDNQTPVDSQAHTLDVVGVRWPYRHVYEQRRLATYDRTHAAACVRCGPSGKPALPGSGWSAAHQHADALRIVGKTILRDLWVTAG